jgi:uncharacterized protein YvpB
MPEKKIIKTPHISQILDITKKEWNSSACGIASLAMVLEFHLGKENTPSVDRLLEEGLFLGGFKKDIGWIHNSLVLLAHNHGLHSYHQEFRSHFIDLEKKVGEISSFEEKLVSDGLNKIKNEILKDNPVIVSVRSLFGKNKDSHIIVITGIEIDGDEILGFYYNDSLSDVRGEGENLFVQKERFLNFWKKFAIFISKEV